MPYKDLREFIEALEKSGDLHRIKKEVDWNLEAGAITRKGCEEVGPAILFDRSLRANAEKKQITT